MKCAKNDLYDNYMVSKACALVNVQLEEFQLDRILFTNESVVSSVMLKQRPDVLLSQNKH